MAEQEKEKVIPIVIEGFQINDQNVAFYKLQEFSLILYEKLLSQRKARNFLTLERDKLKTILDNIRHEIKLSNATLTNKNNELDQSQAIYRQDIKETEQEVKSIDYDHVINLSELKMWEKNLLLKNEVKYYEEELVLLNEKRELKVSLSEQNSKCLDDLRYMKRKNNEQLEDIKEKHKEMQIEKELEYSTKFSSTLEHFTLKHEMEMFELEERKNTHLMQLKAINKNRTDELKRFYNSTTSENLAVISDLKKNLENLKKTKGLMSAEDKSLKIENKKFQELLDKTEIQVKALKKHLINYEKDLVSLRNNKRLLNRSKIETNSIKLHSDVTLKTIKEKENLDYMKALDSNTLNTVESFKKHAERKKNHLVKLISTLIEEVHSKQKIINSFRNDPNTKQVLTELKFEYWNPRKLSYELAIMCKAHDDLLKTLWGKLQELCVPEGNLGNILLDLENIGKVGSSLISKQ